MKSPAVNNVARSVAMLLALMLALLVPQGGAFAQDRPAFSQAQLEQMLAPIALYPDPLLSQILMASTYPLEVVEAARWSRSHANLSGEDAVRAAVNENWDPSVKSLLAFPHVLARMDEDLQWLQTLGDAFLAQESQVMDAVQNLRRRAQVAGNLRSDERQRIVETGPILVVQPADPQIIHVPYYDPRVVYGPWWWPHYSPVYWRLWRMAGHRQRLLLGTVDQDFDRIFLRRLRLVAPPCPGSALQFPSLRGCASRGHHPP